MERSEPDSSGRDGDPARRSGRGPDVARPGPRPRTRPDAGPGLASTDPAETAPPAQLSLWHVLDADTYSLTPATVPLHARLPGAYEWPLPAMDRLETICFHRRDGPAHLAVMQAADGRLFHWGEDFRFLREHLDAGGIDSREIRAVADPGAFMQPLRAAAHAACERSLQGADARSASAWAPQSADGNRLGLDSPVHSPPHRDHCDPTAARRPVHSARPQLLVRSLTT